MAAKAMNVKLEEAKIMDLKRVAAVFHMTMTEAFNEAVDTYLSKVKRDPFYRLTANVEEASTAESEEILNALEMMTDDDLAISTVKTFSI